MKFKSKRTKKLYEKYIKIFSADTISEEEKEEIYQELLKAYLTWKNKKK